jgi:hypothetical protein
VIKAAAAIFLAALLAPAAACAQEETRERRPGSSGTVLREGDAGVVIVGADGKERRLLREDGLQPGDQVVAKRGPAELELGDGAQVALKRKAGIQVGDPLRLDRGLVFVRGDGVRFRAGASLLTVRGEAELELSRRGDLEVRVHMGFVAIAVNGEDHQVGEGKRVKVDKRGKVGYPREFTPKQLAFVAALLRAHLGPPLLDERFDGPSLQRYTKRVGDHDPERGVVTAVKSEDGGAREQCVLLGRQRSDPRGLVVYEPTARLLIQFRVTGSSFLLIQVWNNTQKANFSCEVPLKAKRVGRWTEVELPLKRLTSRDLRLEPGDKLSTIGVRAGHRGDEVTLELDALGVYPLKAARR